MSGFSEIEKNLKQVLTEIKGRALQVLAVEAEKSIKMNFESGGRPVQILSKACLFLSDLLP